MPKISQPTFTIGGEEWTLDQLLEAARAWGGRQGGGGLQVTNPLSYGAAMYRHEGSPFTYNPISGQMTLGTNPNAALYEKYGGVPGQMSFMYLRDPSQGSGEGAFVPVPITSQNLQDYLNAPADVQERIKRMTPAEFDAFSRWNAATSGAGGGEAGVRNDYGAGTAGANPLGEGFATFAENFPYGRRAEVSDRERQRRADARAAVNAAANTPEASAVVKRMLTQQVPGMVSLNVDPSDLFPGGQYQQANLTGIQQLIAEMNQRGMFGSAPVSGWTEYFGGPSYYGGGMSEEERQQKQQEIARTIAGDYNRMIETKAMDLVGRRNLTYDNAMRLAERQLRRGYLGSIKGDQGGMGLSTWG